MASSTTVTPPTASTALNRPALLPLDLLGQPAVMVSKVMLSFFEQVKRAAQSNATVLITGESGVGKELIARAIHAYSRRQAHAWVDLSCAALPEHLLESELFGHERGAFSGAESAKPGLFELAHQGTIFLDEIGELDVRMQAKLLRILDGVPYYRLGGLRKVSTNVRVVAATNKNLEQAVEKHLFRGDLFHRLCQLRLRVPPLRDRVQDIAPLATFFLNREHPSMQLDSSAIARLEAYHWPGNVRELRNAIIQAAVLSANLTLTAQDLALGGAQNQTAHDWTLGDQRMPVPSSSELLGVSTWIATSHPTGSRRDVVSSLAPSSSLDAMEKRMIFQALSLTAGHQQKAAAHLGISRRTLSRKLKQYQSKPAQLAS
ncbi:MAG: sigma-54 dependent transcriptional regulator [Acidobacteriota bacterium]